MTVTDQFTFTPAEAPTEPLDTIPEIADVENPCDKCGRETGWSGRGRKKRVCDTCKPARQTSGPGVRVTGKSDQLAAQAAKTLANVNQMMALAIGAMGYFRTGSMLIQNNEEFEKSAYQALLTDPGFCQSILKVGGMSAKASLSMAYVSLGMSVAPTMVEEFREKKAAKLVGMEPG